MSANNKYVDDQDLLEGFCDDEEEQDNIQPEIQVATVTQAYEEPEKYTPQKTFEETYYGKLLNLLFDKDNSVDKDKYRNVGKNIFNNSIDADNSIAMILIHGLLNLQIFLNSSDVDNFRRKRGDVKIFFEKLFSVEINDGKWDTTINAIKEVLSYKGIEFSNIYALPSLDHSVISVKALEKEIYIIIDRISVNKLDEISSIKDKTKAHEVIKKILNGEKIVRKNIRSLAKDSILIDENKNEVVNQEYNIKGKKITVGGNNYLQCGKGMNEASTSFFLELGKYLLDNDIKDTTILNRLLTNIKKLK